MSYMISSRSVTDGVSLSVSRSKLVYNSMIFVDTGGLPTTDLEICRGSPGPQGTPTNILL